MELDLGFYIKSMHSYKLKDPMSLSLERSSKISSKHLKATWQQTQKQPGNIHISKYLYNNQTQCTCKKMSWKLSSLRRRSIDLPLEATKLSISK